MLILKTFKCSAYAILLAVLLFNASALQAQNQAPLLLLDRTIEAGEKQDFPFLIDQTFDAAYINMPVYVAHGLQAGHPLSAGVHGDEINGSEIARRAFAKIDPVSLRGTVIMLPMINTAGIRNGERYMPDRRDLNRYFPGSYDGSIASIVARGTFDLVATHCDTLIDLHTGSFRAYPVSSQTYYP